MFSLSSLLSQRDSGSAYIAADPRSRARTILALVPSITAGIAVILGFGLLPRVACAQTSVVDFTGGTTSTLGGFMLGYDIGVTIPQTITGLGFFDVGGNGLGESHQIGLWTNAGVLLASTTITNTSTAVASTSSMGRWMVNSISDVTLTGGIYVVGAYYATASDSVVSDAAITTVPGVGYVADRNSRGSFTYPAFSGGSSRASGRYMGPGLFTGVISATPGVAPEPGSLALLLPIMGTVGMAIRKRRNK